MLDTTSAQDLFKVLFMDHALPKFIFDVRTLEILEANYAAETVYGYAREDLLSMNVLDIRPPELAAESDRIRTADSHQPRYKAVHRTRSGRLLDVDEYSQNIEFKGRTARIATIVDVSVRELAQHALSDAETLLQAIIDNVTEPIFIKDIEGRYVMINNAGARSRGFEPADVIGRTAFEISGAEAEPFDAHDQEVLRRREPVEMIHRIAVGGETRSIQVSKAPWLDRCGNLRGVIGIGRDITEHERASEAVRAAERKYHSLFHRMTHGVVYHNTAGEIVSANTAAERMLGLTLDQMQGRTSFDPRWRAMREDGSPMEGPDHPAALALRTGEEISNVIVGVYNPKDNDTRWLLVNAVPEFEDGAAAPTSAFATFNDITHLRRTEQALRDSQERLEVMLEQLPAILWTTDIRLRFTWSDGAAFKSIGLSPEDVVGRCVSDLLPAGSIPEVHLRALNGESSTFETEFRGRWFRFTVQPLRNRDGHIDGVLGLALDVTDRALAEAEAKANEERFRAMLEYSTEIVLVADTQGATIFSSVSAVNVLGFTAEEIAERGNLWGLVHPDDLHRVQKIYERVFARPGVPISYQVRAPHKDGTWRDMEVVARNMLHDPVIQGVILNVRDVTERRAAEVRLSESEEQLRQAQKMEAVGRLAGGIAHDFNNVLTAICGHADLLSEMFGSHDPRLSDIAEIKRAADRATALTRQLLAFSRRHVLQPVVIDLTRVVADVRNMLERLIGADITLRWESDPSSGKPLVHADRTQLEQVLLNLVVNARDAMPHGGTLTVGVDVIEANGAFINVLGTVADGTYVRLSVADTGEGIAPEALPLIFEPFFTTKDRSRGTGLGLSTVYGIVQQSAGHICVSSQPGHGTRFEILLPLVTEAPARPAAAEIPAQTPSQRSSSETVLIVEDEPSVRSMSERILRRHGYEILTAANGAEALRIAAQREKIDLVLTDIMMPEMSGRELARRLTELRPEMRFLFMSGYTYDEIAAQDMVSSELQFLEKPFSPDGLAGKVRAVLAARNSA